MHPINFWTKFCHPRNGSRVSSAVYRDALTQLFQDDEEWQIFKRVFGVIIVLRESLPLHDFARLLGMSHKQVKSVQSRLTSLQTRGTFDEQIVHPASERFHSSFIEFTMNQEAEVGNPSTPYLIDSQMAHQSMAEGCSSFLNDFLSSFRGRECRHSDLHGLELYTVKFWLLHMANSNDCFTPLPPKLSNLLFKLPENHLRQWGSWFLSISIPTSSQNWDKVLDLIDTSAKVKFVWPCLVAFDCSVGWLKPQGRDCHGLPVGFSYLFCI